MTQIFYVEIKANKHLKLYVLRMVIYSNNVIFKIINAIIKMISFYFVQMNNNPYLIIFIKMIKKKY